MIIGIILYEITELIGKFVRIIAQLDYNLSKIIIKKKKHSHSKTVYYKIADNDIK